MKGTPIQWCDDTANPMQGCDGCELFPTSIEFIERSLEQKMAFLFPNETQFKKTIHQAFDGFTQSDVYKNREDIVEWILEYLRINAKKSEVMECTDHISSLFRCYAGGLTLRRGGTNAGYPAKFEIPKLFPGRMTLAAKAKSCIAEPRLDKPWLDGLPRLIFVSDMGDALSKAVPFEYLLKEIVNVAVSPNGQLHLWLWLTKQPRRMLEFDRWLVGKGIAWPDNLVPMTSVTSGKTLGRVQTLANMRAKCKGLSVEPLWTPVNLPLDGIHWVIGGGESGAYAKQFDLAWARDIRSQCQAAGVAYFVKQLGAKPTDNGVPLKLKDRHGGDWTEWPEDLRIREMPEYFQQYAGRTVELA